MASYTYPLEISKADLLQLKEMIAMEPWQDQFDASLDCFEWEPSDGGSNDHVVINMSDTQSIFLCRWLDGKTRSGHIVQPKNACEIALKNRVRIAYAECISKLAASV